MPDSMSRFKRPQIKSVCVVGSGVMGSGIAAHMANAAIKCLMLDVAYTGGSKEERNKRPKEALERLLVSKPALLFDKKFAENIEIGTIEDDLGKIKDCDLVIEAIVEQMPAKKELFQRLEELKGPHTVVASNTSGLSVSGMLEGRSKAFCEQFLVMHFFNPVRYLHLLEIVPGKQTLPEVLQQVTSFAEEKLGKGVVIGKDTPNFVANRIGVYAMMETMALMQKEGYTIEEVDSIFGPGIGRPKSAVFRTADIVGLDTFIHVAQNCFENLTQDECRAVFAIPDFLQQMVKKGYLGQKSGQGFYKKDGNSIFAIDLKTLAYREKQKPRFDSIGEIRHMENLSEKLSYLAYAEDKAGALFFKMAAKTCIYSANRLYEIADDIVQIDNALKWGFGWDLGPFETWDAISVPKSVERMEKEGFKVPVWVSDMLKSGRTSFYEEKDGKRYYYCPKRKGMQEIKTDPKEWQLITLKKDARKIVEDDDAVSLVDSGMGALICEFHTKMNAIDDSVVRGIHRAIDLCEEGKFEALVLANDGKNFSVGANLLLVYMVAQQQDWQTIDMAVKAFQDVGKRLRYCSVPTVAAPFQLTLGGGTELSLWCDRIWAHGELYMGLPEVGVGLIPGGGGNVLMLAHILDGIVDTPTFAIEPYLQRCLEIIAMVKIATSAEEAFTLQFLQKGDGFSMNRRYQLHDACTLAVGMARSGYRIPEKRSFRLPGPNTAGTCEMALMAMHRGGFVSDHDMKIARKLVFIMTGGNTSSWSKVSEDYLLDLEREAFLSLCGEEKSLARIAYMLEHNKPLRN